MEISSPYKVKEVKFQRNYPGYIYRREIVDNSDYGGDGNLEMVNCYESENGQWIGNPKTARMLCKKYGLRNIHKLKDSHCVCSIGFNKDEQKWYGWSHRAIYGFGIGSTCKKGDCAYIPSNFDELKADCHCRDKKGQCSANCSVEMREVTAPNSIDGALEVVPGSEILPVECKPSNCVFSLGKGEWVANTIEDAKQMAIDFAEGVS